MERPAQTGASPPRRGAELEYLPGIVKGAAINLGGALALKILTLANTVLIARFLTTTDVGRYYLGLTLFQFIGSLSLFGLDTGMMRYVPIFRARGDLASMKGVVSGGALVAGSLGLATALPLMLFAGPVASTWFDDPGLGPVLRAIAPAIPFFVVATVLLAGTQGLGRMQYRVYVRQVAEPLLRFGGTVALFALGMRLWGVVTAFVFSNVVGFVLAYVFQRRQFVRFEGAARVPPEWRSVFFFALPQTFSRFLMLLIMWTDTLMLGMLASSDQVGLYSIAARTAVLGIVVADAFNLMLASLISGLRESGKLKELDSAFKSVTKWSFTLSWPLLLLFLVLPREVLAVYESSYQTAWPALVLLAASQVVNIVTGPVAQMIIMTGSAWLNLANNLGVALLNVGLNALLIPRFGIQGAALATMTSVILLNLVRLLEVRLLLGLQPYRWSILKPVLAGLAAAGAAVGAGAALQGAPGHVPLVAGGMALLAVYSGLILLLGFDANDRFVLGRLRTKLAGMRG